MEGFRAEELLRLPVRVHGIQLGRPVDLIVDFGPPPRVLGIDVLCGDDEHRFLPLAAATVNEDEIDVASSLMLLESPQLRYYRDRGRTLRAARGAVVARGDAVIGEVRDLVIDNGGAVAAVVVDGDDEQRVELDAEVQIRVPRRPAA